MTVKVIKLVTGEQVVCDLSDAVDENNEKVGFKIVFPYTVVMIPMPPEEGQPPKFDVNYIVWMSASADSEFFIPYSSVIAIANPAPEVEEVYMQRFNEALDESTHST